VIFIVLLGVYSYESFGFGAFSPTRTKTFPAVFVFLVFSGSGPPQLSSDLRFIWAHFLSKLSRDTLSVSLPPYIFASFFLPRPMMHVAITPFPSAVCPHPCPGIVRRPPFFLLISRHMGIPPSLLFPSATSWNVRYDVFLFQLPVSLFFLSRSRDPSYYLLVSVCCLARLAFELRFSSLLLFPSVGRTFL